MRFRLKTDFVTYARDQIRGGLWYKPSWWEAVQKAPPTPPVGRIRKREVPHVRFVEDKLVREFTARNPALKAFDDSNVAAARAAHTVAAQFVAQQLHHMRNNVATERAYSAATAWLVENGRKVLARAEPSLRSAGKVDAAVVPPRDLFDRVMASQTTLLDGVLKTAAKTADDRLKGLPPYRDFRSAASRAALAARAASAEARMPSGYTTADEAAEAAAKPLQ